MMTQATWADLADYGFKHHRISFKSKDAERRARKTAGTYLNRHFGKAMNGGMTEEMLRAEIRHGETAAYFLKYAGKEAANGLLEARAAARAKAVREWETMRDPELQGELQRELDELAAKDRANPSGGDGFVMQSLVMDMSETLKVTNALLSLLVKKSCGGMTFDEEAFRNDLRELGTAESQKTDEVDDVEMYDFDNDVDGDGAKMYANDAEAYEGKLAAIKARLSRPESYLVPRQA